MWASIRRQEDFQVHNNYWQNVQRLVELFLSKESQNIASLSAQIFRSLQEDGVWHIFGSGHSALLADELFHRAGGLVPVNSLTEVSFSPLVNPAVNRERERDESNALALLEGHDLREGEILLIISNSGINGVSVEMALQAKKLGLNVAALTSVEHSRSAKSRHSSGKKLFEVADFVIDSSLPAGDAVLEWEIASTSEAQTFRTGASSMVLGAVALHTLESMVVGKYAEEGKVPPVYISANSAGGDKHNAELEAKYESRIFKLRRADGKQ